MPRRQRRCCHGLIGLTHGTGLQRRDASIRRCYRHRQSRETIDEDMPGFFDDPAAAVKFDNAPRIRKIGDKLTGQQPPGDVGAAFRWIDFTRFDERKRHGWRKCLAFARAFTALRRGNLDLAKAQGDDRRRAFRPGAPPNQSSSARLRVWWPDSQTDVFHHTSGGPARHG